MFLDLSPPHSDSAHQIARHLFLGIFKKEEAFNMPPCEAKSVFPIRRPAKIPEIQRP